MTCIRCGAVIPAGWPRLVIRTGVMVTVQCAVCARRDRDEEEA